MNYLASIQKDPTPINLNTLPVDDHPTKEFTQNGLVQNVINLLTNEKDRDQFLQQVEAAISIPFNQEHSMIDTPTIEEIETSKLIIKEEDKVWLVEVMEHISTSMSAFEFTLDRLSQLIYLSPRQIRRRLKRLTGKTFSQLLKEARLKEAHRLLVNKETKSIKKVAYQIGLRDVKYFSKQFKLYFGKAPSVYLT